MSTNESKTESEKNEDSRVIIKSVNKCITLRYTREIANEKELSRQQIACLDEIWSYIELSTKVTKSGIYEYLTNKMMDISRYDMNNLLRYIREDEIDVSKNDLEANA